MPDPAHIVLLSTGQPASNPRLVKEADALAAAGYRVTVLHCFWADWAQQQDTVILSRATWQAVQVGGAPGRQTGLYAWTRLRRKIAALFPGYLPALKRAFCRAYDELLAEATRQKADLYIAHNLGALPAAAEAARRNKSRYAFDAEDYHRGEQAPDSEHARQVRKFEDRYFPRAAYITAAGSAIATAYQAAYPDLSFTSIRNVFSLSLQPVFRKTDADWPIKLFWFSQTVGLDRGLQDALAALNLLPGIPFRIRLVGRATEPVRRQLTDLLQHREHTIEFIEPVPEKELIGLAAACDIGLALERAVPYNRDICLTNKIFTYLLAGNALIASETTAQKQFIEDFTGVGQSYPIGDVGALVGIFSHYHSNRALLEKTRRDAWELARRELNWENEQKKLLALVQSVL